jgi:hypothetical protein
MHFTAKNDLRLDLARLEEAKAAALTSGDVHDVDFETIQTGRIQTGYLK